MLLYLPTVTPWPSSLLHRKDMPTRSGSNLYALKFGAGSSRISGRFISRGCSDSQFVAFR